jgi:N-acetylmuramoyl-L-alanine amidase
MWRMRLISLLLLLFAAVWDTAASGSLRAEEAPPDGHDVATVLATRINGNQTRTRFVADMSQTVSFNAYVLPDPHRVIIDLPEVDFRLKTSRARQQMGLISEYRYGPLREGQSRIVIDTSGPVLVDRSFMLRPNGGQPARLVVDLVKVTEEAFARAYERQEKRHEAEAQPETSAATPIVEAMPLKPEKERPKGRRLIVIDPGHGGVDPGAIGVSGTREKDVVLAFALKLRDVIRSAGIHDVVMTREDDRFMSLKDRVRFTRDHHADLLIAIHADTVRGQSARGATLYTLSDKASDAEAEALAEKENRADIIAGVNLDEESPEVTDILIDLVQRESRTHSVFFARKAAAELKTATLMTGKPVRSAGFMVLKAPDVPSVLLELGYLSSTSDEELLGSEAWRKRVAEALNSAIERYFSTEIAQRQ